MNLAEGAIEPGTILVGKYRIESVLGRGGMGIVYRADHMALNEPIAIKVLRRDVSVDEETVHRFKREAQSAAKLKSEHVARIHDVGEFEDGLPYMVMEYLEGADLGQLVDTNGAMNVPVAVDLLLQACDAIAEAHSHGIVHRDIKPSNLFVSFRPDSTVIVKVLDFGISKSATGADLSLTQTSSMLGTPAYMSPEQMRSARTVDVRTDIWSIGTVLYELLEARRPFDAESFSEMCVMVAMDPPVPMVNAREIEPIILKCLAKHPDQRYPTVPDLMRELAAFAGNPEAARHFVTRAYRVLGMPVPQNLGTDPAIRPVTYQTPVPGLLMSNVMPAATARPTRAFAPNESTMGTATIASVKLKPNRTMAIVLVLCVLLGVGGAIGYVKATEADDVAAVTTDDAGAETGSATATGSGDGSAVAGAGSSTAEPVGSGSAVTNVSSGLDAGSGNATGSGAGSARAGSGSATVATVGGRPPKGGGKPPKGGGKPPKGGDSGKGAGSAKNAGSAAPPKPKCDPFNSVRDGC